MHDVCMIQKMQRTFTHNNVHNDDFVCDDDDGDDEDILETGCSGTIPCLPATFSDYLSKFM